MPKATVSRVAVERQLKTCPGGWVKLRTLSFYEMIERRDLSGRMYQETKRGPKQKGKQRQDELRSVLELAQMQVIEYEFKNCIVDHNLEDDNGPIDFTSALSFRSLDPKIGAEIGKYIDELNQDMDDDEDLDSFPSAPSSLPLVGETPPSDTEKNELESA